MGDAMVGGWGDPAYVRPRSKTACGRSETRNFNFNFNMGKKEILINPFSTKPIFGQKKKVFFKKLYSYFSFYAGEINLESFFFLAKRQLFFPIRMKKVKKIKINMIYFYPNL